MSLSKRQHLNIWWRYIGRPRATNPARLAILAIALTAYLIFGR